MMNGRAKSDSAIVAGKPTNKAGQPAAESVEPSAEAEGNASQQAATSSRDAGPRHEEVLRRCGSRHTSTGCGRRSRKTPPALPSWSPKRAVTRWCHNPPPGPRPLATKQAQGLRLLRGRSPDGSR